MMRSTLKVNSIHKKVFKILSLIIFPLLTLFLISSSGYAGYSPVTIDSGENNYSAELDSYQRDVVYTKINYELVGWEGGNPVYKYLGDIYLYQQGSGASTITVRPADTDMRHPSIWGDRIAWQDSRNDPVNQNNLDIYLYDSSTATPHIYQLTTSAAKQTEPDIFGDYVVWLDGRNGGGNNFDVYLYDLSVDSDGNGIPNYQESSRPNPDPALKRLTTSASVLNQEPRVYGHRVVWYQNSSPDARVYSYDLDTGAQTQLASGISGKPRPSLYRDMVIWLENSGSKVYKYDFNSPGRTFVVNSAWPLTTPSLWGDNFAAEADNGSSDWNVRIYNLSGSQLWESGAADTYEKNPTLFGDPGAGTGLVAWAQDLYDPEAYDNNIIAAGISDSDSAAPAAPTAVAAVDAGSGGALNITWTHSASTDTAGYKLYWGTSSGNTTNSVDVYDVDSFKLTGLANGQTYYTRLKAYDTSGNLSAGYSSESSASPSPNILPETTIVSPTGGTTLITSPQLITGAATDTVAVDGVEVSIKRSSDGYWWTGSNWVSGSQAWLSATITSGRYTSSATWQYSWTLPTSDSGGYNIYARAQDNSPEYDPTPAQVTVTVDNSAPTGSIVINNGASYTTTAAVTLNLSATDGGGVSEMRFSTDNVAWSGWEPYGATKSFNLAAGDGNQTAYVQYRDGSLNESTVYNDTIFVDSAGPASFMSALGDYITTNTVSLAWNGADPAPASGIAAYDLQSRFESGSWTDWTTDTAQTNGVFTTTNGEGHYGWRVRARDNAGNQESYRSLPDATVTVDWSAPTDPTTFTSPDTTGTSLGHNQITLNWSADATDNVSGVDGYSIDWDNSPTPAGGPVKNVDYAQTTTDSPVLADGNNWYAHLRTVDKAGNWTSTKNLGPFWIDTVAPVTSMTADPAAPDGANGWYNTTTPTITLTPDETATTYYSWDSTAAPTTYTVAFDAPAGSHTLHYYSVDPAGNSEIIKSQDFKVDTQAPATSMTADPAAPDGANGWYNTTTPTITLTPDETATTYYSWDSTAAPSTYTAPFNAPAGSHTLYYYSVDSANDTESVNSQAFKVDTTAPDAFTLNTPADNSWQITGSPNFTWNASADAGSGLAKYQLWIDGVLNKDNISSTQAQPASALSDGSHIWYVKAIDNAGNSTNSNTYTVKVDTTAPNTFNVSAPANNSWQITGSPNFTWNASADAGSGLAKYQLWIDGVLNKDNISSTQSQPTSALSDGSHIWYVKAIDNAGNSTNSNTYTVKIDTQAPTNPVAATEGSGVQDNAVNNVVSDPDFTWSGFSDTGGSGVAGFYYYFGTNPSGSATNWTTSAAYNPGPVSPGTYYLRVKTKDKAGNSSNWKTLFTFKYQAPVFTKTQSWSSGAWPAAGNKLAAGDFNNDGYQDIVSFYNYPATRQVKAWVWLNDGAGNYSAPQMWWDSGPNNWDWAGTKLAVGDFDNNGQDDLVAFYGYAAQRQTRAWVFTTSGSSFNQPTKWWDSGPGNWDWAGTNLQVGDYNGNGATDLLAFYGYAAQRQARAFVFTAAAAHFNAPTVWWDSGPNNWDMAGAKLSSGDYSGDGQDDILAFYAYFATHQTKAIVFTAGTNNFTSGFWWDSGPNNWDWGGTKLASGNFDTSPGSDIAALYGYSGNQTRIFVFGANPGANQFKAPTTWWDSGPGNWSWSATTLLSGNVSAGPTLDELLGFYNPGGNTSKIYRFE